MECGDRGVVRSQRHEHRLQRELDEHQDAQADDPPGLTADERQDQHREREPAQQVAEVAMGHERARVVEHAESGEKHLEDATGDEDGGDDGQRLPRERTGHGRLLWTRDRPVHDDLAGVGRHGTGVPIGVPTSARAAAPLRDPRLGRPCPPRVPARSPRTGRGPGASRRCSTRGCARSSATARAGR